MMKRTRLGWLAIWMGALLLYTGPVHAITDVATRPALTGQQATPEPREETVPTGATSAAATPAVATSVGITETLGLTTTAPLTGSTVISATPILSETAEAATIDDAAYAGVLQGTILANRTDSAIRFFVEGQTYTLDALRSIGLDLPRVSAVLNLFNCDAATPETQEGCYWDPYLLARDGFYEIVTGVEGGVAVNLMLREAGAPTTTEIWIQNRTGKVETVVYRNTVYQLAPAAVEEFTVDADEMPTFFLRSCVNVGTVSACEWLPVVAEAGVYYGLVEIESAGGLANSEVATLDLRPVLADDPERHPTAERDALYPTGAGAQRA